jgi:hypothetical protein
VHAHALGYDAHMRRFYENTAQRLREFYCLWLGHEWYRRRTRGRNLHLEDGELWAEIVYQCLRCGSVYTERKRARLGIKEDSK